MKRVVKAIRNIFSPSYSKLNPTSLGLAGGILSGLLIFFTTLATAFFGMFPSFTGILIDIYGSLGFSATPGGAMFGAIYSFIDGFILCYIFAWIYNKFL